MKIEWKKFNINNVETEALITTLSGFRDKFKIRRLYKRWKNLNDDLKKISTRGINLPETISENAFCLFFKECVRVVKLKNGKCSYDVLNTKTGSRIQIKASSIEEDLTSFGPRSEWDELFFMDFSEGNGIFKVYKIDADLIYKHQVNKNQTFEDQQGEGRRPRFSIMNDIIIPRKIKPIKICKL
jgi:hypothetical protein